MAVVSTTPALTCPATSSGSISILPAASGFRSKAQRRQRRPHGGLSGHRRSRATAEQPAGTLVAERVHSRLGRSAKLGLGPWTTMICRDGGVDQEFRNRAPWPCSVLALQPWDWASGAAGAPGRRVKRQSWTTRTKIIRRKTVIGGTTDGTQVGNTIIMLQRAPIFGGFFWSFARFHPWSSALPGHPGVRRFAARPHLNRRSSSRSCSRPCG